MRYRLLLLPAAALVVLLALFVGLNEFGGCPYKDTINVPAELVSYTPCENREIRPGVFKHVPCSARVRLRDGSEWDVDICVLNPTSKPGDKIWACAFEGLISGRVRNVFLTTVVGPKAGAVR